MKRLVLVLGLALALAVPASASSAVITPVLPVAPYGSWNSQNGVMVVISPGGFWYSAAPGFGIIDTGSFVVSPAVKQLRLTSDGIDYCPFGSSALYQWRSSGSFLRLQAIQDSCPTRRAALTNRLFLKVSPI